MACYATCYGSCYVVLLRAAGHLVTAVSSVDDAVRLGELARRWQTGMHVDRAWRDHPQISASQHAVLVAVTSCAGRDRVVTARLSKIAAALGRTGPRAGDQIGRVLTHLEGLGVLERSRTRRGAGVTRLRIARAAGGYDVVPWELLRAVQAGDVEAGVLRTWSHLAQGMGARGWTRDSNTVLAASAGVSARTLAGHLAQLERVGMISRTSGPRRAIVRGGARGPVATPISRTSGTAVPAVDARSEFAVHSYATELDGDAADAGSPHVADAGSIEDLAPETVLTPEESFSSSRSDRLVGNRAAFATFGLRPMPKKDPAQDVMDELKGSRWMRWDVRRWHNGVRAAIRRRLEQGMSPGAATHALLTAVDELTPEAAAHSDLDAPTNPVTVAKNALRALRIDIRCGDACLDCGRSAAEAWQDDLTDGRCTWCTERVAGLEEIPAEDLAAVHASLGLTTDASTETASEDMTDDPCQGESSQGPSSQLEGLNAREAIHVEPSSGSQVASSRDHRSCVPSKGAHPIRRMAHRPSTISTLARTSRDDRSTDMAHRHTPDCTIEHGTWRCYIDHKCRRTECREAWRTYGAHRNRQIAYGRREVGHPVSGSMARAHVEWLLHEGMTVTAILEQSGLSHRTVSRIRQGQGVWSTTRDAVLSVVPEPRIVTDETPNAALVDGAGTRRRLRALTVLGWNCAQLAELHGGAPQVLRGAMLKAESQPTRADYARSVRDLYEQLWDRHPPVTDRYQKSQYTRVRKDALERGWAPPMAWDEESIDDPDAQPAPWQEVTDLGSGRRRMHLDDLEDCIRWGLDVAGAAERLGVTKDGVETCLKRAERPDILEGLRRNGIALHHVA